MSALESLTPETMLAYYRRLYPFKPLFNWLNHSHAPSKLFTHREFAFTLQGDVYLRYNSFATAEDLKKQICTLNPTRFEIGPIYSARPRDKRTVRPTAFSPLQREFVVDIDMTDYDEVRTCCTGADICNRCWRFIAAAVRVLDAAIRDQFGYKHLLWVYSGRRGIHLWVSDEEALGLTDDERRALVGWLTVVQGGKELVKKVNVRLGGRAQILPPSVRDALDELAVVFGDLILADQNCFGSAEGENKLLQLLPKGEIRDVLARTWAKNPGRSSEDKWADLKSEVKTRTAKDSPERKVIQAALEDIILQYTYPRLDAEVSKHRNHLLKAPFCIHPKTARVCVPVDPSKIDEFDPGSVPTVGELLAELDKAGDMEVDEEGGVRADWEKTSLRPYVEMMERHALGLMNETRLAKRAAGDMTW